MMENQLKLFKIIKYFVKFKTGVVYSFSLVLLVFLVSSCGISTYIYIYPPIKNGINLSFSHDSRNNKDPNFFNLGYDIYYRIYDNSAGSQFNGKTASEIDNILMADGNTFFTSDNINKLLFRAFDTDSLYKPLKHFSNDKSLDYSVPPFLPVDNSVIADKSFYINIILNSTNRNDPYLETVAPYSSITLPETIKFRRYISNDFKDFTTFNNSDEDINFTIIDDNFLVTFFVLSYGFTVNYYTLTSDKPIYIGYTIFS